jgi:hypothetical protein
VTSNVVQIAVARRKRQLEQDAYYTAGHARAESFGYCVRIRELLGKLTRRSAKPGETPEQVAARIVRHPQETL